MSLRDVQDEHQRIQHQLASCLGVRARKLRELWAVSSTSPSHPLPDSPTDLSPNAALDQFLEQNSLEKYLNSCPASSTLSTNALLHSGHFFSEDTLPPRPRHQWSVADITPPLESSFTIRDHDPARPSVPPPSDNPRPSLGSDTGHPVDDEDNAADASDPGDDDDHTGFAAAIPTPRSTIEHEHTGSPALQSSSQPGLAKTKEPRLPPDKTSTPHSPPYSPQERPKPISPAPTAPLGVSKNEASSVPRGLSQYQERDNPEASTDSLTRARHTDRTRVPASRSDANDHTASSTSSPDGPRSADTSRAGGRSTATSPDRDPLTRSASPPRAAGTPAVASRKRKELHDVEMVDAEPRSPRQLASSAPKAPRQPPLQLREPREAQTGVAFLTHPERKRKRRWRSRDACSVVLAKAGPPERDVELVRTMQRYTGADDRVPSKKKDWMHVLFLRQALDQAAGQKADLNSLLGSSNKVLTTADWQLSLREKQDCSIIKRIYEWQQVSRWPLRQPRLPPEVPPPRSHQDSLLAELKWLQTDFREERKFKVAACGQLARACQQWWLSNREDREHLQNRSGLGICSLSLDDGEQMTKEESEDWEAEEDDSTAHANLQVLTTFPPSRTTPASLQQPGELLLNKEIANHLPLYEPWKASLHNLGDGSRSTLTHGGLTSMPSSHSFGAAEHTTKGATTALEPEDTSCALFQPEWEALRRRQQIPFAFKPPNASMPPPGFYEHRRPSTWTEEEDRQLKAWAKDFPSNWNLISERHSKNSQFVPAPNRRTPWECYERLVTIMEGAAADPTTRQYAKQFQGQVERIRTRWQNSVQQQAQHAQSNGQQFIAPRFPTPQHIERKQTNKRFLALVDGARKLAKKREASESTKRQAQESANHAHRPTASIPSETRYTPEALSLLKHRRQLEYNEKQERMRQDQRAFLAAQQRGAYPGHGANQQMLNNYTAQRLPGAPQAAGSLPANTHLAVPGASSQRPFTQQQNQQYPMTNGVPNSQQLRQMMMNSQNQMAMRAAQRPGQPHNSAQQVGDLNVQQQLLRQQSRNNAPLQAQRQVGNQGPLNRASPNLMNGTPNINLTGQMNQQSVNKDAAQSPRPDQAAFSTPGQGNATAGHAMMVGQYAAGHSSNPAHPQTLSSGGTPTVLLLQHQIAQQNPGLTEEEVKIMANNELKNLVEAKSNAGTTAQDRSRQNAINAASGLHSSLQQGGQHSRTNSGLKAQNANVYNVPAQLAGQQAQAAYGRQNGMLGTNQAPAASGQNNNYAQQMRQATSQQMRRSGVMSPGASGQMQGSQNNEVGSMPSPALQRNSMQPPSAAMSPSDGARPGSAQMATTPRLASQSPRPLSSQGQAAQG